MIFEGGSDPLPPPPLDPCMTKKEVMGPKNKNIEDQAFTIVANKTVCIKITAGSKSYRMICHLVLSKLRNT